MCISLVDGSAGFEQERCDERRWLEWQARPLLAAAFTLGLGRLLRRQHHLFPGLAPQRRRVPRFMVQLELERAAERARLNRRPHDARSEVPRASRHLQAAQQLVLYTMRCSLVRTDNSHWHWHSAWQFCDRAMRWVPTILLLLGGIQQRRQARRRHACCRQCRQLPRRECIVLGAQDRRQLLGTLA